jgi:hypothetical protein
MGQLQDLRAAAQNGQELSAENLWPAQLSLDGGATPIACSGGSLQHTGLALALGGHTEDYDVGLRVRIALLPSIPKFGISFLWRRIQEDGTPETDWRGPVRLMRLIEPTDATTVTMFGQNPNK